MRIIFIYKTDILKLYFQSMGWSRWWGGEGAGHKIKLCKLCLDKLNTYTCTSNQAHTSLTVYW